MKRIFQLTLIACATIMMVACNSKQTSASSDNATIETIMSRTSIRQFTDQKLTDEQIETLLKAAMAAPTAMNMQPWSFVVLTDTSAFDKIFEGNRRGEIYKKAAATVVFCGDTLATMRSRETGEMETRPNKFWVQDVTLSVENFLLAAKSMGLGAVYTACYPDYQLVGNVKKGLGLPDSVLPLCVVPVGYPADNPEPKDKWKPEKIHYNKW